MLTMWGISALAERDPQNMVWTGSFVELLIFGGRRRQRTALLRMQKLPEH